METYRDSLWLARGEDIIIHLGYFSFLAFMYAVRTSLQDYVKSADEHSSEGLMFNGSGNPLELETQELVGIVTQEDLLLCSTQSLVCSRSNRWSAYLKHLKTGLQRALSKWKTYHDTTVKPRLAKSNLGCILSGRH